MEKHGDINTDISVIPNSHQKLLEYKRVNYRSSMLKNKAPTMETHNYFRLCTRSDN